MRIYLTQFFLAFYVQLLIFYSEKSKIPNLKNVLAVLAENLNLLVH